MAHSTRKMFNRHGDDVAVILQRAKEVAHYARELQAVHTAFNALNSSSLLIEVLNLSDSQKDMAEDRLVGMSEDADKELRGLLRPLN